MQRGRPGGRAGVRGCRARQFRGSADDPPCEPDLEGIVAGGLGVRERRLGSSTEAAAPAGAGRQRSAVCARHGFSATPPSAIRPGDHAAFDAQGRGADTTANA